MPTSKSRVNRDPSLKGIPREILNRAPRDWSPSKQAGWCRAYMRGLVSIDLTREQRLGSYQLRLAHSRGQRESTDEKLVAAADSYFSTQDLKRERDYNMSLRSRLSGLCAPRPFHLLQPEPWQRSR